MKVRKKRRARAVVISSYTEKGGNAKTTNSITAAHLLAKQGYATLLIDNDPQQNAAACMLHDSELASPQLIGVNEVLLKQQPIESAVYESKYESLPLFVCPFTPKGTNYDESDITMADFPRREATMKYAIEPILNDFDFIFIDCPGNFNVYTKNALTASDYVLVPVEADRYSLEGMSLLMQHVRSIRKTDNPQLDILGVVLVKDRMTNQHVSYKAIFAEQMKDKFFKTSIRLSIDVSDSTNYFVPVTQLYPKSKISQDYEALTREILKRVKRRA